MRVERINKTGNKKQIEGNQKMKDEYKRKYDKDNINWFTDGGCKNNGDENAIAACAYYA